MALLHDILVKQRMIIQSITTLLKKSRTKHTAFKFCIKHVNSQQQKIPSEERTRFVERQYGEP